MSTVFHPLFQRPTPYRIAFDIALVMLLAVLAVLYQWQESQEHSSTLLTHAFWVAAGFSTLSSGMGLYESAPLSAAQLRWRTLAVLGLSVPMAYIASHTASMALAQQRFFGWTLLAALGLVLLHRAHVAGQRVGRSERKRVLVYGAGPRARAVGHLLSRLNPQMELVGYYASAAERQALGPSNAEPDSATWLAENGSLLELVQQQGVQEIVIAVHERRGGTLALRELLDCKTHGVQVMDMVTHFEKTTGSIRGDAVSAGWLVFGDGFAQGPLRRAVKRGFDIMCASALLLLALPVLLLACLLILLESGGPVLYRQTRVGLYGQPFCMFKLRSMRQDAEGDGQARWASAGDSRITRVGRLLRRLRIDELPQLVNVLAGDMSLVGPRPERPCFVQLLTRDLPYYAVRHSVKPGITGWAQVRYQYGASLEETAAKLEYDLYYVKHHSLLLDLLILLDTVGVVLTGKGAR